MSATSFNPSGEVRIRKVKRNAKGVVTINYEVENGTEWDEFSMKCKSEPHPDLIFALGNLIPHVMAICELPESYREDLTVSGVSFTYKETENNGTVSGAVITSQKLLKNHPAPLIINTPHKTDVPYSETSDTAACLSTEAAMALENVKTEAVEYIKGKRGEAAPEGDQLMETVED
jgi:hypothetical protein